MDRLEDNITDAKCNTGDTVNELKEALKTEAGSRLEPRCLADASMR